MEHYIISCRVLCVKLPQIEGRFCDYNQMKLICDYPQVWGDKVVLVETTDRRPITLGRLIEKQSKRMYPVLFKYYSHYKLKVIAYKTHRFNQVYCEMDVDFFCNRADIFERMSITSYVTHWISNMPIEDNFMKSHNEVGEDKCNEVINID